MALEPSHGFAHVATNHRSQPVTDGGPPELPIFNVEPVQLQFAIASDFVAAQVANNALVLALSTGRIIRIDLDNPAEIDDVDLPKKASEVGIIKRLFLDPTASHLLICTSSGENYYLHSQSRTPRALSRLRSVQIDCVAWNPALPTASTREILLGAHDGCIYEAYIETSTEFYRKEDKYLKILQRVQDGPVTGLWVDGPWEGKADVRRVVIATGSRVLHLVGRLGRLSHEGGGSIFTKLFETEVPTVHEVGQLGAAPSLLVTSPDAPDAHDGGVDLDRVYAWLSPQGIYHGNLISSPLSPELGTKLFSESRMLPRTQLPTAVTPGGRRRPQQDVIESIALTQWHILCLMGGRIVAINRLDERVVFDQVVLEPGETALGLYADRQKNTFWLFTAHDIYEIVATDEDRDVWKVMIQSEQFDAALRYARTPVQKDAVATASGDHLFAKGAYIDAAGVYGKSSKSFEQVALSFVDANQPDALRKYLLTKITAYKKGHAMQRTMLASWLVEIFMAKLNSLDDTILTKAELTEGSSPAQSADQREKVQAEFREFVIKYKGDLDQRTTYDIISAHGREAELLAFAKAINDSTFVLSYWMQRDRWADALDVLKQQTDPDIFYRYSSGLIIHVAEELVDVLMRHADLEPRKLIPALLNYDATFTGPLSRNQAVRYLLHVINRLNSSDAAVHNTLISIYASHSQPSSSTTSSTSSPSTDDESALLAYLESQGPEPSYDADFALRLCIRHARVHACVHIYTTMGQYLPAVELALAHGQVDVASLVADRPVGNAALRKGLWLAVAKSVIGRSSGVRTAIEFLKRCDLLKIEDLIPFFPDFVVIDDFKEEICTALEEYSRHIDALKGEMDESARTASNIKSDIRALDHRYAIVEPGEQCHDCSLPLLTRQFFVFPCQHAFHSDCLARRVMEQVGVGKARRLREVQRLLQGGLLQGGKREEAIAELDALVAGACILCSDFAIKRIDEPFVKAVDDQREWAL